MHFNITHKGNSFFVELERPFGKKGYFIIDESRTAGSQLLRIYPFVDISIFIKKNLKKIIKFSFFCSDILMRKSNFEFFFMSEILKVRE